ncbi:MAG: hypothetical protein L0Z53_04250 [Acidobacteriales bacterium]|nr:hypothetical protein [Terriglobales bacterium]
MKFARLLLVVAVGFASAYTALGQSDEPKIQDNSFLVEEAYNQEFGVVQHIQNFAFDFETDDWAYTFTQEWPIDLNPRHQFSYTVPIVHSGDFPATGGGLGPVLLNYRYQLIGNGDSTIAFSPRISAILPTGDHRKGRSFGGAGVAIQLPLSAVVNRKLVTHWNVGTFIVPSTKNEFGDKAATYGYNFGQSFVWNLRPRVNLLLETVFVSDEDVIAPNNTQRENHIFLNPAIRWAYNLTSGMQIVPGIGVPIGVGPSRGEKGIFLYLSIEHPYRKINK